MRPDLDSYKNFKAKTHKHGTRGKRRLVIPKEKPAPEVNVEIKTKKIIYAYDTTTDGKVPVRRLPRYKRFTKIPKYIKDKVAEKYNIKPELLRRYLLKFLSRPEELSLLQATIVYDLINEILLAHKRIRVLAELKREALQEKQLKLKELYGFHKSKEK